MQNHEAIIAALAQAPSIVIPLVREMPAELLKRRPAPGKWSVHEHACHITQVDPVFHARLDLMLSEAEPVIRPYDPGDSTPDDALLRQDLDEALAAWMRERERLVERIRGLGPGDWERTAQHPEYSRYSVLIMFRHLALHDIFHAYRIEELVLSRNLDRDG